MPTAKWCRRCRTEVLPSATHALPCSPPPCKCPIWVPASNYWLLTASEGTSTEQLPRAGASRRHECVRNESGMVCLHSTYRILYPGSSNICSNTLPSITASHSFLISLLTPILTNMYLIFKKLHNHDPSLATVLSCSLPSWPRPSSLEPYPGLAKLIRIILNYNLLTTLQCLNVAITLPCFGVTRPLLPRSSLIILSASI